MLSYETKKNDLIEKIENGDALTASDLVTGRGRVIEFDDLPPRTRERFYKNYVTGDYQDEYERRTACEIAYYSIAPTVYSD